MAARLFFGSVPKTNPNVTKPSQHRTPFSAVAASRFLQTSRLEASTTLETIHEEHMTTTSGEAKKGVADLLTTDYSPSVQLSSRATCFVQMHKQLPKNSDDFRSACHSGVVCFSFGASLLTGLAFGFIT